MERRVADLEGLVRRLEGLLDQAQRSGKRQAAPFSKGSPKENPQKPGRKPGKEYGKQTRREEPPQVDEVHHASLPEQSSCCHAPVKKTGRTRQFQTEIVCSQVHRRFDIDVGTCTSCGSRLQGRHPLQTCDATGAAASQLGAQAKSLFVHLNKDLGVSYGKIQKLFRDLFGVRLSRSGACRSVLGTARKAQPACTQIEQVVRKSRRVYPDETGWKVGGRLWWMWAFVARRAVLYKIAPSRGSDVLLKVLGPGYSGVVGHDGWAPYDALAFAVHQQCLAHLLRRCEHLLERATRGAVRFPRAVKTVLQEALGIRDRCRRGEISNHGVAVARGRLQKRMERLLRWSRSHAANERFAGHLHRHADQLFAFLEHPNVEATNWPAEQAIRPAVVNRKVWGGNRTKRGARAQEILLSVLQTCKVRGVHALTFLRDLIQSPQPTLIPLATR